MSGSFAIELFDGELDGGIELFDGSECLVSEKVSLEVAPGALDVVELRGVLGQPLDGQPGSFGDGGAIELAGMDGPVVEHQDDRRPELLDCRFDTGTTRHDHHRIP